MPLSAGRSALATRQLNRMGRIENDWIACICHDRQSSHIGNQHIIAKTGAAFAEHDAFVTGRRDLGRRIRHVPRCEELTFFDVYHSARRPGGQQQIRLAAKKCRNLQDITDFGSFGAMICLMDVGQNGTAELVLDLGKVFKAELDAQPALAGQR